jgi:hypothetical protein
MAEAWLSYADIAKALGTSPEAPRQKAILGRWRRQRGNDGRALVLVDLEAGALPTAPSPSTPSKSSAASTPSHRLPRRIAVAQDLEADARIGIGAEHPVSLRLEDRVVRIVRIGQSRGAVQSRGGVLPRVGLRNRWGCHDSGKGNGEHYDLPCS